MLKIFVSATSRDLKSYRKVVAEWGAAHGHAIVVQDEFEVMSDYGTIVHMLRDKLDPCDAVIHLAGLYYGFEPTNVPKGEARRSYTQLEFELGRVHKRQVFRFIARPEYTPDNPIEQTEELAELQRQHRQRLMTGDQAYHHFTTHEELRTLLDKLQIQATLSKPQNLPLVGSLFKGRDEFLEQLRKVLLTKPTHIAAVTAKQAIHGLGGVGKTRAAVEYAKRYSDEYTALLFITADSEANLRTHLANLCGALVLNLPEREAREQEVQVAAAIRWLREHTGWFLIVDNVDTPEAATAVEALMQKLDTGHVVITSRLSSWGGAVQELALDVLAEADAQELLLERTAGKRKPMPTDDAEALALAKDLGCLPLALEQAGAFIVEDGCSFAEYQKLWKAHDDEVLSWHSHLMKYPRSVATTWQTSFDKVGPDGRALLRILCWLAPEPIPLTMLEKLDSSSGEEAINWKKGRRDLARYSFAKWSDDTHTGIVVHRLVQEITEYRLSDGEKLVWLKRSLGMVNEFFPPEAYDVRFWPECRAARPHVFSVTAHAEAVGSPEPTARLMAQLALYLNSRVEHAVAEPLYRRALGILETLIESEYANVASTLNGLAMLLQATNRLPEAESLFRRALAINTANYGPDHLRVAVNLNNLAELLRVTNRPAEAEPLFRRVVNIFELSLGPGHSDLAAVLGNLANLLYDTNRVSEAEPLYRRALTIQEANFGPKHPDVARCLTNLAGLLRTTNRLTEAEPLFRRALAIVEASYGPDHSDVACDLGNMAGLLLATNRSTEAEPLLWRALAIDEACFGLVHPDVARDLNNLAEFLRATNRPAEAEPLLWRALAIDEASYECDHPSVAIKLNNLAVLFLATDRLAEAESFFRRALAIDETSYGTNHPYTARDLNNLAELLRATNRFAESEPLFRRALAIYELSYGSDHPDVARELNNLALLLRATNRLAEAEPLFLRAAMITIQSLGVEHPSSVTVLGNYASLLRAMGRGEADIQAALGSAVAKAQSAGSS